MKYIKEHKKRKEHKKQEEHKRLKEHKKLKGHMQLKVGHIIPNNLNYNLPYWSSYTISHRLHLLDNLLNNGLLDLYLLDWLGSLLIQFKIQEALQFIFQLLNIQLLGLSFKLGHTLSKFHMTSKGCIQFSTRLDSSQSHISILELKFEQSQFHIRRPVANIQRIRLSTHPKLEQAIIKLELIKLVGLELEQVKQPFIIQERVRLLLIAPKYLNNKEIIITGNYATLDATTG